MQETNGLLAPSPPGPVPARLLPRRTRGRGIPRRIKVAPPARMRRRGPARRRHGVVIGRLSGIDESGGPLIDDPGRPGGDRLPARSMVALTRDQVGREVVLMFEGGDP